MKPGMLPIVPQIPDIMPAKLGAISTIDESGPEVPEPWNVIANVINVMASIRLVPKNANAAIIMALGIQPLNYVLKLKLFRYEYYI